MLTYYVGSTTKGKPLAAAPTAPGKYTVVASFAGSEDYAPAQSTPVKFTIVKAQPMLVVADTAGTYTGRPFVATATIVDANGAAAASLEGVRPTLKYYAGSKPKGIQLGRAPTAAGTYTVVASFAGSATTRPL